MPPVAAFPLSLQQAARILQLDPDGVVDLVRTGELGAYLAARHETSDVPPLRFHPDALPSIAVALGDPESPTSDTFRITRGLRSFLAERAPTGDYSMALEQGRPVLAQARSRRLYAHVQVEMVQRYLVDRLPDSARASQVRLRRAEMITETLRRLGCQRVRGIRPLGSTRQVWAVWWRVPRSIWSELDDTVTDLADLSAFGGAREPGESLERDADGEFLPGLVNDEASA